MDDIGKLGQSIKTAAATAKPWQRIPTTTPGVFIVKAPTRGDQKTIMIELNPVDELGRPVKRRGIFLQNATQFKLFKDLMNLKECSRVAQALDTINKTARDGTGDTGKIKI